MADFVLFNCREHEKEVSDFSWVSKDIFNFDRSSLNLLQLSTIAGFCTILRIVYPCPASEDFVPQYRIIAGMAMWTEVKNGFCFGHGVDFVLHGQKVSDLFSNSFTN
jgi:hypothetical protein